MYVSKTHMK
jgi:hypothetical protein